MKKTKKIMELLITLCSTIATFYAAITLTILTTTHGKSLTASIVLKPPNNYNNIGRGIIRCYEKLA